MTPADLTSYGSQLSLNNMGSSSTVCNVYDLMTMQLAGDQYASLIAEIQELKAMIRSKK